MEFIISISPIYRTYGAYLNAHTCVYFFYANTEMIQARKCECSIMLKRF